MFRSSQTPQSSYQHNILRNSQPLKLNSELSLSQRRNSLVNEENFGKIPPKNENESDNKTEEISKNKRVDNLEDQNSMQNQLTHKNSTSSLTINSHPKRSKTSRSSDRLSSRTLSPIPNKPRCSTSPQKSPISSSQPNKRPSRKLKMVDSSHQNCPSDPSERSENTKNKCYY